MRDKYMIMLELSMETGIAGPAPGWRVSVVKQHASGEGQELLRPVMVTPEMVMAAVSQLGPSALRRIVAQGNAAVRDELASTRSRLRETVGRLEATEHALASWDRTLDSLGEKPQAEGDGDDSTGSQAVNSEPLLGTVDWRFARSHDLPSPFTAADHVRGTTWHHRGDDSEEPGGIALVRHMKDEHGLEKEAPMHTSHRQMLINHARLHPEARD